MSAKAILSAKLSSFPFEDRILILDVPAKIGRSHRDDTSNSGNGMFDCKVLSRQHAILLYEDDGRFYLMDTGSSNGSFINNIRLSKSGEESQLTEIFTNDVLRFGSDVIDKSRQVTQKAVVGKIRLYNPDGSETPTRPSESRLFRPTDSMEDLHSLTRTLQESLSREKMLEDKLVKVKTIIARNIGRSHTDLMRTMEDVKQELMHLYEERCGLNIEKEAYDKITEENLGLTRRINELERLLEERDQCYLNVQKRQQADALENMALKKACQLQKKEIETYEETVKKLEDDLYKHSVEMEAELRSKIDNHERSLADMVSNYEDELHKQEALFTEERTRLKDQMKVIAQNEANLLNRIKSLENNEAYERAEIDKVLNKEREEKEAQQELMYKVECLESELEYARTIIECKEAESVSQRLPEDVEKIEHQNQLIEKLNKDLNYVRRELIEARSHKAASDDELMTIKGHIETYQNTIESLEEESNKIKAEADKLRNQIQELVTENNRLENLVSNMQNSSNNDEMSKVQIADLQNELSKCEYNLKSKCGEMNTLAKEIREKDEIIQQKEIELACAQGQIQILTEDQSAKSDRSVVLSALEAENSKLVSQVQDLKTEVQNFETERSSLSEELQRQKTLYNELKKMRGKTEEMDLFQKCQDETATARNQAMKLERELGTLTVRTESLQEEKTRLLRQIAQMKRDFSEKIHINSEEDSQTLPTAPESSQSKNIDTSLTSNQAKLSKIGNLRVYEVMLGVFFISVILNYILSMPLKNI